MQQFCFTVLGDDNDEEPPDFNIRSLSLNELNSEQSMSQRKEEEKGGDDREKNDTICAGGDGKSFHCQPSFLAFFMLF